MFDIRHEHRRSCIFIYGTYTKMALVEKSALSIDRACQSTVYENNIFEIMKINMDNSIEMTTVNFSWR